MAKTKRWLKKGTSAPGWARRRAPCQREVLDNQQFLAHPFRRLRAATAGALASPTASGDVGSVRVASRDSIQFEDGFAPSEPTAHDEDA